MSAQAAAAPSARRRQALPQLRLPRRPGPSRMSWCCAGARSVRADYTSGPQPFIWETTPLAAAATITSNETALASATTSTYVSGLAMLALQQWPNPAQVAAGGTTVLTIDYVNTGAAAA